MRDGAIVVPEPFLRLFEVTTDDVDERIYGDFHRRIESVEVVHRIMRASMYDLWLRAYS